MRCLVTGGLGFIGSHIADRLIKEGHRVRIFDNLSASKVLNPKYLAGRAELIHGDILDFDKCQEISKDIDIVFHNAAICNLRRSFESPNEIYQVNVLGTKNIIKASKESKVKQFIFSSSAKIYGNTDNLPTKEENKPNLSSPYATSKYNAENICKEFAQESALSIEVLRYFSVYGPRQEFGYGIIGEIVTGALNGGNFSLSASKEIRRDFTYIEDVIDANILCMKPPNTNYEIFNISSGRSYSLPQLTKIIATILNKEIRITCKPLLEGMVLKTHGDISKAGNLLNYTPKTTLEEGLRKTIDWFRSNQENLETKLEITLT